MFPALDHARKCSYRIHTYLGNVTEDLVTLGSGRRLDILRIEQPTAVLQHVPSQLLSIFLLQKDHSSRRHLDGVGKLN